MPVTIDETISRNRTLETLVQSANAILERMVQRLADEVTVDWIETADEHGKPIVIVTLRDFSGSVFTRFTPGELSNPQYVRERLREIWLDLLQMGTKTLNKSMQEKLRQIEEN